MPVSRELWYTRTTEKRTVSHFPTEHAEPCCWKAPNSGFDFFEDLSAGLLFGAGRVIRTDDSVGCVLVRLFRFSFSRFVSPVRSVLESLLAIVIVLAAIGLGWGRQASAQITLSPADAARIDWLASLTNGQISDICGPSKIAGDPFGESHYDECVGRYLGLRALAIVSAFGGNRNPELSSSLIDRMRAKGSTGSAAGTSSTFAPTFFSSTPGLPFLGNPLSVLSWVPNSTTAADATASYAVGLIRQSDCSLDESYVLPGAGLPQAEYLTSLTEAQDYFHQLSGLTTKPDVFANGCNPQVLGLHASNTGLLLGQTSDGAAIGAQLASSGLYVTITDYTANTVTNTQVTSGSNPGAFYAASLRGNGIMDLVETGLTDPANSSPATAVLLGNGDGTFQKPVYYDVSANSYGNAAGFTVDDVTGDGIPDIVILNGTIGTYNGTVIPVTGTVTTLIGKGDGTFTVGPVSSLNWTDSLQVVSGVFKTGDVKDLLVGGTVLLGTGTGSFTQGSTNNSLAALNEYTAAAGGNAVGSLRNNGKLDVVVSVPEFASIFYGNGDGTFQAGPSYAAPPDFMQATITDIDGDGNPDIVLGTSSGGVFAEGGYDTPIPMFQILMGRGDGTFVDSPAYALGTYSRDKDIASADFNGDGKADVLVFNNSTTGPSTLAMLPGDGTGALGTAVTSSINMSPSMLVAAKMNHDTLADVVVAGSGNSGPEVSILTNQGTGAFAAEQDYSLASAAVSLVVGDFNGDGIADVAVGESGQGVFVLFGQANGTLGKPVQVDTSANPTGLAAGSLTTDGRTDLVVADQTTGAVNVYLGNADGSFTAKTSPTTGVSNLSLAALGDLNNDGKLDLIVYGFVPGASPNPNVANVYTFLGNGDGTFQAVNTLALVDTDTSAASLAVADFNKDGNADVVIGNQDDYTEVLFSNGDGTLAETVLALGQQSTTVAAADLLGNGYPEILVGEGDTQGQGYSLTVFQNQPNGWTAPVATPTVTVTASPSSITTAQSTTVTVTVSGATGSPTPTGSITLTSGSYTSAATTLAGGSAAITVPGASLAIATDTVTASYTPDSASASIYNSATGSGSVTVTAVVVPPVPPGFALTNSGNITVSPGATTGNTSTITVTPSGGLTGAVALACAITPTAASAPATCTLSPASVTITDTTAQTSTLSVATTAATTASMDRRNAPWYAAGGISLACVVLFLVPARRRHLRMMAGIVILSGLASLGIVSCGGGGGGGGSKNNGGGSTTTNPGTTAGTYTVTVTGAAGSTTETTTVTLTVN